MKKILLRILLVAIALLIGYFLFLYYANYSTGTRSGSIMKISQKGVLIKTNEGLMDIGTINDPWAFSVEKGNQEILDKLDEVQKTGERVQVHYEEKFRKLFWRGDTKYFVIKVEKLNE